MADISKIQIESGTYDIKDITARNSISTLESKIDSITSGIKPIGMNKVIFVGDSYASRTDNWVAPLIEKLGLSSSEYHILAQGSTGFCCPNGVTNETWIDMIQNYVNNLSSSEKSEISHVIVCGGANDNTYTENQIYAAIGTFTSYVNNNLPNALTYIGMIGWTRDATKIIDYANVVRTYTKCNQINRCYYLNNVEYTLHNYTYIISDNVHPDSYGCFAIATNIHSCLMQGTCDIVYSQRKTSFSFNLYETLNNNICSLYSNRTNLVNLSSSPISITCDGDTGVDLGAADTHYLWGNYFQTCRTSCECVISYGATSPLTRESLPCTIGIYQGHLYLYVLKVASDGSYATLTNVKYISIPQFNIVLDSLTC